MTRLLEDTKFYIASASQTQNIILREINTYSVSAYFARKHCFPAMPILVGQWYTIIQTHIKHIKPRVTTKEILYKLSTTFIIIHPVDLTCR